MNEALFWYIKRHIWIYLPPDYEIGISSKRYSAIYTHWGQLIFNEYHNSNEWRLDRLMTNTFNNLSSCDILKWGLISVAIEALSNKFLSDMEYIVSGEEKGCHSRNLIRTLSSSFKQHIHANYRTINRWNYTTVLSYDTAGGLVFDLMTKYYQTFGKFIIHSWILDEDCCESEVEINDALATSHLFCNEHCSTKSFISKDLFFTWTLDEESAEITRAGDNARGFKHGGMPISNIYVDPINTKTTAEFHGIQTMKAICWLFNNHSAESYLDIAPWWEQKIIHR